MLHTLKSIHPVEINSFLAPNSPLFPVPSLLILCALVSGCSSLKPAPPSHRFDTGTLQNQPIVSTIHPGGLQLLSEERILAKRNKANTDGEQSTPIETTLVTKPKVTEASPPIKEEKEDNKKGNSSDKSEEQSDTDNDSDTISDYSSDYSDIEDTSGELIEDEVEQKGGPKDQASQMDKDTNSKQESSEKHICSTPNYCYDPQEATHFIRDIYKLNGIELGATKPEELYNYCKKQKAIFFNTLPKVGDIIFFNNTEDLNDNSKKDDWFSHAAIVTKVSKRGEVSFIGWEKGHLVTRHINRKRPTKSPKKSASSQMRGLKEGENLSKQQFADQLFAGYCGLLKDKDHFDLIENWSP